MKDYGDTGPCHEDCTRCSGEYCERHGASPCECDVIERHYTNQTKPKGAMMIEFHLGNDEPGIPQDYDWVVTHYDIGDWYGEGTGAAYKDGKLYVWDFSHCSCFGPLDYGPDEYDVASLDWESVTVLADLDNDVRNKVQELLTGKEST